VRILAPKREMLSCEEQRGEKPPLVQSDPVVLEINSLQNQLKGSYSNLFFYMFLFQRHSI